MIDEIKKTFKKRVKEHEWIDDKTTKYVFEKVSYSFLDISQNIILKRTLSICRERLTNFLIDFLYFRDLDSHFRQFLSTWLVALGFTPRQKTIRH